MKYFSSFLSFLLSIICSITHFVRIFSIFFRFWFFVYWIIFHSLTFCFFKRFATYGCRHPCNLNNGPSNISLLTFLLVVRNFICDIFNLLIKLGVREIRAFLKCYFSILHKLLSIYFLQILLNSMFKLLLQCNTYPLSQY